MLDLFNIAKPQGCDIQIFYGSGAVTTDGQKTWLKPRGVSHIYMMLIGPGGTGDGTTPGGSGAVTVWYGAAQHVPDSLVVIAGVSEGPATYVSARFSNSGLAPETLLVASKANNATGGTAMAANQFAASGFFKSTAGVSGDNTTPSSTTFLSSGSIGTQTGNYGYTRTGLDKSGYFQMQPIIVGLGGYGDGRGGIGCGGGTSVLNGKGGPGMVLIASW